MLLSQVRHLTEDEFAAKRPIESLDRELVHVPELQTHGDVVVCLDALDFAPEHQLFCLNLGLESVQSHLDLHALVQVESDAVVAEVFDLLREVQNVHFVCAFSRN